MFNAARPILNFQVLSLELQLASASWKGGKLEERPLKDQSS